MKTDQSIELTTDTSIVRNLNLFASEIDDDLVVLDDEQGCYFTLNIVAKRIWNALESPMSYQDLLKILLTQYEVDQDQCRRDVEPFIADMLKNKLIQIESSS